MAIAGYSLATMPQFVGRELGVSDWLVVGQDRIDAFAACTQDRQWIHVDPERARREGPFGGTIAHGFLTLALIAPLAMRVGVVPADAGAALNYRIDKVRFMTPVRAGARVRNRIVLLAADDRGHGRVLMKTRNTLEIEGEDRPALVAETVALLTAGAWPGEAGYATEAT
jgi:acyl dehydratase